MDTVKEETIGTIEEINKVEEYCSLSEIVLKASIALSAGTIAFLSRNIFSEEVASIFGSYETKTVLEHFLTGVTFSFGVELHKKRDYGLAIGYAILSTVWETRQYHDNGYFQYGQLIADYTGCAVGPALMYLKELKK